MDILEYLLGFALLVGLLWDVIAATLSLSGHSIISKLSSRVVSVAYALTPKRLRKHVAPLSGGLTLCTLFISWFVLLWFAWALIFVADSASVLHSATKAPADTISTIYFTGFTIITLGIGDYVPAPGVWQLLTVIASVSGFFLATMVITYALPVLSAVVQKRKLASSISGLGGTPEDLIRAAWDGSRYCLLDPQLLLLTGQLQEIEKQHLAYPVLHNFLTPDSESALPVSLSSLDDFVSFVCEVAPPDQQPRKEIVAPLRNAIDSFLSTLSHSFVKPSSRTPDIPGVPDPVRRRAEVVFAGLQSRRRLLAGWLEQVDHEWPRGRALDQSGPTASSKQDSR